MGSHSELALATRSGVQRARLRSWHVPEHLVAAIENLLTEPWQGAMLNLRMQY